MNKFEEERFYRPDDTNSALTESYLLRREKPSFENLDFDVVIYPGNVIPEAYVLDFDRIFFDHSEVSKIMPIIELFDTGKPVAINSEFPDDALKRFVGETRQSQRYSNPIIFLSSEQLNDPIYYRTLANQLGVNTANMMLFSSQNPISLEALISTGTGIISVNRPEELAQAVDLILDPFAYKEMTYEDIAGLLYTPGKIRIIGLTGRAGTGKTTMSEKFAQTINQVGGKAISIDLDAFFYMSSIERRAWVNEVGISEEDLKNRHNMTNWINHALINDTFARIRAGKHIHLKEMYSMADGGEKVATFDFDPDPTGFTVILGGTALFDPRLAIGFDTAIYINTHEEVRRGAIWQRDSRRKYTREDYGKRLQLTQGSETQDCFPRTRRIEIYNSGVILQVLDNTQRTDKLISLPGYIPQR